MDLILISMACALVAFVYSVVLTEPGQVLNGWYNFLATWLYDGRATPESRKFAPMIKPQGLYLPWLFMPLVGCYRCVTGQLALWYYFYAYSQAYNFAAQVFFVCFAIYTSIAINKIHTWLTQ